MEKAKKFLAIGCILLILMTVLTACDEVEMEKSITSITSFTVEDLSNEEFYSNVLYEDFKLDVYYEESYTEEDIKVVVSDPSVIEITYEKDENFLDGIYISFDINTISHGDVSFYFETSDGIIKSEEVRLNILNNIESIEISDVSDITFNHWSDTETLIFSVKSNKSISEKGDVLKFVSENPEVVTVSYDEDSWFSDSCTIEKKGPGETFVYIQTLDGSVKSEKVKVIVEEEETEPQSNSEDTYYGGGVVDEPIDNSRTVYVTPYGKKYHYSLSCAGENGSPISENTAKNSYGPCKKCAQ